MKARFSLYSLLLILLLSSTRGIGEIQYTITTLDNPAPGYILLDPSPETQSISLFDNSGNTAYTKLVENQMGQIINLKVLSNGYLAAFCAFPPRWAFFNQDLELVESISAPSNMTTDFHDFILLSNRNYLLIGTDNITKDMSLLVPNGSQQASIKDFIILEMDHSGNVIFQWRASDHFSVTDATEDIDLTQKNIDPFHINSLFEDSDGNLIISMRHMDEITKINKQTGAIIWRLGGSKSRNNQFTFTNDTYQSFTGFSHQHNAQILSNGHLLIFDNGNLKPTQYSRVVEYSLNTSNMSITKVWEYRNTPDFYIVAMGNVQRLPNGNTFVGWSNGSLNNTIVVAQEVTSNGTKVFEITNPSKVTYRATKSVFKMNAVSQSINGTGQYIFNDSRYTTGVQLNIESITGSALTSIEKHNYRPYNLQFRDEVPHVILPYRWVINQRGISRLSGKITININNLGDLANPNWLQIYTRPSENSGNFYPLITSYNESSNQLEANITSNGEFMIGYKEYYIPQLELPINNAYGVTTNTKLTWNKTPVEEKFDLQVSNSPYFNSFVVDFTSLDTNCYTLTNLSYFKDYYWRVKSHTSLGSGSWSTVFTFQTIIDNPNPVTPNNLQKEINTTGKLNWTSVNGGTNYRLQVSDNPEFNNPKIDVTLANLLSYNYKDLDNYKTYYWRICASNRGVFGAWSDVWQFQTIMTLPKLTYPADKTEGIPIAGTFKWDNVNGATIYSLQVSTDSAYQNVVINETGISTNQLAFKDLNYLTGYYWRVKALNNDTKTEWSHSSYFITFLQATNLIIPKDNAGNIATKAVYSWETIPGATEYQLEIALDSLFKNIHHSTKLAGTSYTCTDLKYSTLYYWRVKTFKQTVEGGTSPVRKFRTINQDAVTWPDLSSPADNSFNISLSTDISWEACHNATSYNFEVSANDKFSNKLKAESTLGETKATINNLEFNHKYYWHVQSCRNSVCSDWSDTWSFTTKLASSNLLSPKNNETDVKLNSELRWEPVDGGIFYWLQIAMDTEFKNLIEYRDNLNSLSFISDRLEQQTTYYWRVKAINAKNASDWSEVRSFLTGKIASVEEQKEITRIYPNPASDFIYLENMNFYSLLIFDAMGNQVMSLSETSNRLDISNLPNGVYNLRTYSGNSSQTFKLFVIR